MAITKEKIRAARRHLRGADSVMRRIIDKVGPYTLRIQRDRFLMLVRSITAQQISGKAARSIQGRLFELVGAGKVTPEAILACDFDELRSIGLSQQKATYIVDLAEKTHAGVIRLRTIGRLSDEEVIQHLIQVKGIGRWTAQMFLIFALGRLDVFPDDDLGVQSAIRDHYGLSELPDKRTAHEIAKPWRPYASVASWYCWRILDLARDAKGK